MFVIFIERGYVPNENQVIVLSQLAKVPNNFLHLAIEQCTPLATSFPGSSLFLPRESTLVLAGHVAPKIWVLTRMCYRGGVAKCKIVTSVRMVESTGGDVSFFRQVFLHYIRTFDIEAVHVIFDSEKHVFKSLNFKTLSLTIALVNGSSHESQHNKFTTRGAVGLMLHGAGNEMECQGLGRTNLFLVSPRSSRIFGNRTRDRQTAR